MLLTKIEPQGSMVVNKGGKTGEELFREFTEGKVSKVEIVAKINEIVDKVNLMELSGRKTTEQVDNRRDVEVELSDETFLGIAKMAHSQDITFNRMCEAILRRAIEDIENNGLPERFKKKTRDNGAD